MPKLKPLKDDKDLALIPQDQPVLVDLGPVDEVIEPDDGIEAPLKTKEREPGNDDDGTKLLKEQLEASQAAAAKANEDLAAERAERAKVQNELAEARAAGADNEADAIENGLAAAQAERDAAKAAVKKAFEDGDADALANAQETLGRVSADIREYERAKADLDDRRKRSAEEERERPKVQATPDVNAMIDGMTLLATEKDWLKKHPDAIMDARQRVLLDAAYIRATDRKLSRGTPAYFQFLEQEMGYATPPGRDDDTDDSERTSIVAAPVTRDNRSSISGQRTSPTQVRLTPQQREIAALSGLTDTEYARGLVQMEQDRQANPQKYASR